MDAFDLKVCDVQGRLFELSGAKGYGSSEFIESFMTSQVAKWLDSTYNHMQWAGEEYLLAELVDSTGLKTGGEIYDNEVLYWMGYIYRYWHYYKNESSKDIYRQASVETMKRNWLCFHTFSPELAIEDLKEIYASRTNKNNTNT